MKKLSLLIFAAISFNTFAADQPRYEPPVGNETYLGSLESYAAKLFQPEFTAQQDLNELLEAKFLLDWHFSEEEARQAATSLAATQYSIHFPTKDTDCNPKGWTENFAKTIPAYREKLLSQIDEVVNFLGDYHFRMLGKNETLIKIRRVEICANSRAETQSRMSYDRLAAKLTLWIGPIRGLVVETPILLRSRLHPFTAKQIKEGWNDGDHMKADLSIKEIIDREKSPERVYWSFINPIGKVRVTLRELGRKSGLLSQRSVLQLLKGRNLLKWKDAITKALGGPRTSLEEIPDEKVEGVLEEVLNKWATKLANPETTESLASGALVATIKKRMVKQEKLSIKRTQIGFVNVENFHQIDVSLATGDVKDFADEVAVPENIDIEVTQYGFVNVSTTDKVDVSVALAAMGTPEVLNRAALKSVLKEMQL